MGNPGRLILQLVPFKFRVKNASGVDNVVADAHLRMQG
jgi:hypothetical protein